MSATQIATHLALHDELTDQALRADNPRVPHVVLQWTGSIALPDATFVDITSLTAPSPFGVTPTGAIWDLAQISTGVFSVKREGLLQLDVNLRASVNYTGAVGRIEVNLLDVPTSAQYQMVVAPVIGNYTTSDAIVGYRATIRPAGSYRFRLRWMAQTSPSAFSLGLLFATLAWFPPRS